MKSAAKERRKDPTRAEMRAEFNTARISEAKAQLRRGLEIKADMLTHISPAYTVGAMESCIETALRELENMV